MTTNTYTTDPTDRLWQAAQRGMHLVVESLLPLVLSGLTEQQKLGIVFWFAWIAALNDQAEVLSVLFRCCPLVATYENTRGLRCLWIACRHGNVNAAKMLLEASDDTYGRHAEYGYQHDEFGDRPGSALFVATRHNHVGVLGALCNSRAGIRMLRLSNMVSFARRVPVVVSLLRLKANVQHYRGIVMHMLVAVSAGVNVSSLCQRTTVVSGAEASSIVSGTKKTNGTQGTKSLSAVRAIRAQRDHIRAIEAVVLAKADVNFASYYNFSHDAYTPLQFAMTEPLPAVVRSSIVKLLIRAKANPAVLDAAGKVAAAEIAGAELPGRNECR